MARSVRKMLEELNLNAARPRYARPRLKSGRNRHISYDSPKRLALQHKKLKNMNQEYMTKDMFLANSDLTDYVINLMLAKRIGENLETHYESFGIHSTRKEWTEYSEQIKLRKFQLSDGSGYFFDDVNNSMLDYRIHPTHVSINLCGDIDFITKYAESIKEKFEVVMNEIEWIYSNDGDSINIPLRNDRMPVDEMYPFLGDQKLGDYYDEFMSSSASILLLIGPPGTGKTTFIRGLLQHCEVSAIVSYDSAVLEKDYVFSNFIESNKSLLILEDADMFLKSRKEGNTMMHKFLNVGDGLVTTRGKKLIFSTNLPSINDIDPALTRPGRCYDILHFDELNQEQADTLAAKVGTTLNGQRDKWSIADVFHERESNIRTFKKPVTTKFGFV